MRLALRNAIRKSDLSELNVSKILDDCLREDIFFIHDLERIQSKVTSQERQLEVKVLLMQRPDDRLEAFLSILDRSGHAHIAQALRKQLQHVAPVLPTVDESTGLMACLQFICLCRRFDPTPSDTVNSRAEEADHATPVPPVISEQQPLISAIASTSPTPSYSTFETRNRATEASSLALELGSDAETVTTTAAKPSYSVEAMEEDPVIGPTLAGEELPTSLLPTDCFLIHGGVNRHKKMELFYPLPDHPSKIFDLNTGRRGHTATRLKNGTLLIAGGWDGENGLSCELLDPVSLVHTPTTPLPSPRASHSAEFLNGRVYLCGGWDGGYLRSVLRYEDEVWKEAAPMITARSKFALASDSDSLFTFGGAIGSGLQDNTAKCEAYVESRGKWRAISSMPGGPRHGLRAEFGDDHRFWVVGGLHNHISLRRTEMFDPRSREWMSGPDLNKGRSGHGLVKTVDGRIWALGGGYKNPSVEFLDPRNPIWQSWEKDLEPDCYHSAVATL